MNDFWHMSQQQRQRQQILTREAEQSRLAAQMPHRRTVRIVAPVMFRVGSVLMTWGARLQKQYGEFSAPVDSAHIGRKYAA